MKFLAALLFTLIPNISHASDKVAFVRCENHIAGAPVLTIETINVAEEGRINSIGFWSSTMENCNAMQAQIESKINGVAVSKRALVGVCSLYDGADYTGWLLNRLIIDPDKQLSYSWIRVTSFDDCLRMSKVINDKLEI